MKKRNGIVALLLCCLLAAQLWVGAFAAESPDLEAPCNLTVEYAYDGTVIPEASFRLYRVASFWQDEDEDFRFTPVSPFDAYPIRTLGLTQAGWEKLAQTLAGYVQRDAVEPLAQGVTDEQGRWALEQELSSGLYLLLGEVVVREGYVYTPAPSVFVLPMPEGEEWSYQCVLEPKAEQTLDEPLTRRVLKIWDDDKLQDQRPESVTVELLRSNAQGTAVADTVELNKENRWRHEWKDLDPRYTWRVVEKDVPAGYTVVSEQQGVTCTITNTAQPCEIDPPVKKAITGDTPKTNATFRFVMEAVSNTAGFDVKKMPMPDGSVDGKKTKDIQGPQEFEFGFMRYLREGVYVYRLYEEDTNSAGYTYDTTIYMFTVTVTLENGRLSASGKKSVDGREVREMVFTNKYSATDTPPTPPGPTPPPGPRPILPQTGQLWWPVPVLLIAGIFLTALGLVKRRGARHGK